MRYYYVIVGLIAICCIGCGTFNVIDPVHPKTNNSVVLGSIGTYNSFLSQHEFNKAAVPNIAEPILLTVHTKYFNASTYKRFLEAKSFQNIDLEVHYVDSLPIKPKYLELKIADKVSLVSALNTVENFHEKSYLKNNKNAVTITGVSGAFNTEDFELLTHADAIFLKESRPKQFVIQPYKNGKPQEVLSLSNTVLFGYSASNCCWKENNKHQIDLVDLVSTYSTCPNNTFRSSKKAEKRISHLKF